VQPRSWRRCTSCCGLWYRWKTFHGRNSASQDLRHRLSDIAARLVAEAPPTPQLPVSPPGQRRRLAQSRRTVRRSLNMQQAFTIKLSLQSNCAAAVATRDPQRTATQTQQPTKVCQLPAATTANHARSTHENNAHCLYSPHTHSQGIKAVSSDDDEGNARPTCDPRARCGNWQLWRRPRAPQAGSGEQHCAWHAPACTSECQARACARLPHGLWPAARHTLPCAPPLTRPQCSACCCLVHDCCCPQPSCLPCLPPQYLALMQPNAKQHHPLPVLATTRQTTGNRFAALAAAGAEPALAPVVPQQPAAAAKKDRRMSLRDFLRQPLCVQPRRQQQRPRQVVGARASTLGCAQPAQPKVQLPATPVQLGVWVRGPPVRLGSARPACSEQACGNAAAPAAPAAAVTPAARVEAEPTRTAAPAAAPAAPASAVAAPAAPAAAAPAAVVASTARAPARVPPAAAAAVTATATPSVTRPAMGSHNWAAGQPASANWPYWPPAVLPSWVVQPPPPHLMHPAHVRACYEVDMWSGRVAAAAAGGAFVPYSWAELAAIASWTCYYAGAPVPWW